MSGKTVVLEGYMRKLKTMKKKYFVLFGDSSVTERAHLNYYATEKKYRQSQNKREVANNKRCIILRECFNINRKMDTRHSNVLALYTKDECFSIVFEQESDLQIWLDTMLRLQRDGGLDSGDDPPKPLFEHIWEANIQRKGLGESRSLWGPYRVCITDRSLTLIRVGVNNWTGNADDPQYETIDISLASIRRYGASHCIFYLEIGRVSKTGAGEIWMETADPLIAQNMQDTILRVSRANKPPEDSIPSHYRGRSQSVNDTSKPTFLLNKTIQNNTRVNHATNIETPNENVSSRERCDSLPSYNASMVTPATTNTTVTKIGLPNRPNSLYTRSPTNSSPLSPISLSRSDCDDSSHSVDDVDGFMPSSVGADDQTRNAIKNMSVSHTKMTILEENSEDFSISDKEISELADQNLKISETSTAERGYLVMLPGSAAKQRNETRSRTSSFVEDAPIGLGIRNMDALSSSASSITSGTPSTDTRFSAFHLEKIAAHFSCEETDSLSEQQNRPARTYSVGSRPDFAHQRAASGAGTGGIDKGPIESIRNSRTRAFSLGSKARHYPSIASATLAESAKKNGRKGGTSASEKSTSFPSLNKGSLEVVNDLMEIDFSNNSSNRNTPTESSMSNNSSKFNPIQSPRSPTVSDYMEMNPCSTCKSVSESEDSTTMTNQREMEKNAKNSLQQSSIAESPYVEMSGSHEHRIASEPIAIKAPKKTPYVEYAEPKSSLDNSQNMIFSLSLENINRESEERQPETPPTEPLVSPAVEEKENTTPQNFQPALQAPQEILDADNCGEYTMIAPPQIRATQHNYVELDFPANLTSQPTIRKEVNTNSQHKPLYAQLMFPKTAATAPAAVAAAATTTATSKSSNKKKK